MWAILINILTNTRNFAWTFCKICFPNRKNIPKRILVNKTEYWTFQIGCQKIRKEIFHWLFMCGWNAKLCIAVCIITYVAEFSYCFGRYSGRISVKILEVFNSCFSEKATKIWKNLPLVLTLLSRSSCFVKADGRFFFKFMTFSECLNFYILHYGIISCISEFRRTSNEF